MEASTLTPHLIIGAKFSTTHPDFLRLHEITEVTLLGDYVTKSKRYWLFEGTRADGRKKSFNFSKAKFASGKMDQHFSPI